MKISQGALIFLLGLIGLAASVVAPTKAELEAMYAAAAREVNAGNYSAALQKLDAIDARQPDMAAAHNLRGVALMRLRDFGPAETALRKARELDPELWEARFNLAEVPFLRKSWAEARRRFEALGDGNKEQAQGATADLIQFKIFLTYLLEGKETKAGEVLARLQTSSVSPGYYCGKAALAFRHRNQTEAREALKAAEASFSPRLNRLFVESFYEVGWMEKPAGAVPASLEIDSPGDRVARARADFQKAEERYRQRDYEGALGLLDQVDANAPKQAVSFNLRGEILLAQGRQEGAEAAFRSAIEANPQLEDARYNLARIPFQKRDYAIARKQLEAILGASSGSRQGRQREQLIRYQIFLTLLLEGRDGAAQKAMDEFKMMDDTPALYYAQAAWAFQHGNMAQGNAWVANAGNLYPEDLTRAFATPFADLGWLGKGAAPPLASGTPPVATGTPSVARQESTPVNGATSTVSLAAIPPGETPDVSTPEGPNAPPSAATPAVLTNSPDEPKAAATPEPPKKIVRETKGAPSEKKKLKAGTGQGEQTARSNRKSARVEAASRKIAPPPLPEPPAVTARPHRNLGDVVRDLFIRPRSNDKPPSPGPGESEASSAASPAPARSKN